MPAVKQEDIRKEIKDFIVETFLFGSEEESFGDTDSFMKRESSIPPVFWS